MQFLIVLAALVVVGSARLVVEGRCGGEAVVQNFDVASYTGLWHETYRYEQDFELGADCVTARYTPQGGGVEVLNSQVTNGTFESIVGYAEPAPGAGGSGKLTVNFPSVGPFVSDYWVLATDYSDYSLVYSCRNAEGNTKKISSWILSRRPRLSPQAVLAINPILEAVQGLEWENYRETDNSESACKITRH